MIFGRIVVLSNIRQVAGVQDGQSRLLTYFTGQSIIQQFIWLNTTTRQHPGRYRIIRFLLFDKEYLLIAPNQRDDCLVKILLNFHFWVITPSWYSANSAGLPPTAYSHQSTMFQVFADGFALGTTL